MRKIYLEKYGEGDVVKISANYFLEIFVLLDW
jgi:hypothetical protein